MVPHGRQFITESDGKRLDVLALDEAPLGAQIVLFSAQLLTHVLHISVAKTVWRSPFKFIEIQNQLETLLHPQ